MSAHTPGPWAVEEGYDGSRTVAFMRSPNRTVNVAATQDARPKGHEATTANARLIAAAPELLAACRAALDDDDDQPLQGETRRLLERAIAKAEGR